MCRLVESHFYIVSKILGEGGRKRRGNAEEKAREMSRYRKISHLLVCFPMLKSRLLTSGTGLCHSHGHGGERPSNPMHYVL